MQNVFSEVMSQTEEVGLFGAYRLLTAEIVFADGADEASSITWQDYDLTPGFPRLRAFIDRWRDDPDHKVRSVTVVDIDTAPMPACRISPSTGAIH